MERIRRSLDPSLDRLRRVWKLPENLGRPFLIPAPDRLADHSGHRVFLERYIIRGLTAGAVK
jgi:hypothetical protein